MNEDRRISPFLTQAVDEFRMITKELDEIISLQSGEKPELFAPECMNADCCFHWIRERANDLEKGSDGLI